MYLRVSTVRRGDRTYRYAQLVKSFRRPDGTPTNRVIASLGALSDAAIRNVRAALKASGGGDAVVLPTETTRARVLASLRYLDLAVLLRVWEELGLGALLGRCAHGGASDVSFVQVVAALVLQRCVAPASKLAAERWYPTTALPELQGIAPRQFNNSRIHRVLGGLEAEEETLQDALPGHLQAQEGVATALFVDATDTWFTGRGPPLAEKGVDKEGVYRRRIGLVLLCDQRGYPLRWHTLSGRYRDPTALAQMAQEVARLPWAREVPIIADRALGNADAVYMLHQAGLRYVTAVPSPEFESCGAPIPWEALDALQAERGEGALAAVSARVLEAGFSRVRADRYVRDLGIIQKVAPEETRPSQAVCALDLLEQIEATPALQEVVARLGTTAARLRRYRKLRTLTLSVRQAIREGRADALSLKDLAQVAAAEPDAQPSVLAALAQDAGVARRTAPRGPDDAPPTHPARAVLTFNPTRLLEDREADETHLASAGALVADVNRRLAHPSSRRSDGSALAEVEQQLRKHGLRNAVTPRMERGEDGNRRVLLDVDAAAWARRRRTDGLNLIVAHPEVPGSGPELVKRYFSKDAIEKDFQTIKSVVELRPVHHRTDPKLRAHVTICMLALLLIRALEQRLAAAGRSPREALERLEPIHLAHLEQGTANYYTLSQPTPEVLHLLEALAATDLAADAKIQEAITPR